jgi:cytochrome b561
MQGEMSSARIPGATDTDAQLRYDTRPIRLQRITAALVILIWCAGETIDWFPRGGPRMAVRSLHIVFRVLLGAILCCRIGWRARRGTQSCRWLTL